MAASATDVLAVLRATRREAQRNAAVLDHISTPSNPQPSASEPAPPSPLANPHKCATDAPHPSSCHQDQPQTQPPANPEPDLQAKPQPQLSQPSLQPQKNGKIPQSSSIDNSSTEEPPSSSPGPTPPISKHILLALFAALDAQKSPKEARSRYAFVENDQENHFLYGLVLPVIARLLAVSCPGLLCIVQLPQPDTLPEWSIPSSTYDGYGSNGSNGSHGSKSGTRTTPSPEGASRTPSPSDESGMGMPRQSVSPEGRPRTADLIRHADKILSGREAAAAKRANDSNLTKEGSPPPDSILQDHRALRLICNGFEVLTAKMPRPKHDMGSFTLASVGWEKAGIVSPEDPSKGVSMSFSNGMMTPTEGILVTFSNGSMCFLTLRDPLTTLESLKLDDSNPVIVFSFASVGQLGVGDLLVQDTSALGPEATRIRACLEKPNIFVIEIGHSGSVSSNFSTRDRDGVKEGRKGAQNGRTSIEQYESLANGIEEKSTTQARIPRFPPVAIGNIPRAVPLFVNTINRTFIDPPYYEVHENAYENELINDRYIGGREDVRTGSPSSSDAHAPKQKPSDEKKELEPAEASKPVMATGESKEKEERKAPTSLALDPKAAPPSAPSAPEQQLGELLPQPAQSTAARVPAQSSAMCTPTSVPYSTPQANLGATFASRPAIHPSRPQSMYNYYGYGPSPVYQANSSQPLQQHPTVAQPPRSHLNVHQGNPSMNGPHNGYYHHVPAAGPGATGHYHHHPGGSYPPPYFVPPPNVMHQAPHNAGQWHAGMPPVAHQPTQQFPPPHPMDARRDMPIHFASHRAVTSPVDGRYPSHFYPRPSNAGHLPHHNQSHPYTDTTQEQRRHLPTASQEANQDKTGASRLQNGKLPGGQKSGAPHARATVPNVMANGMPKTPDAMSTGQGSFQNSHHPSADALGRDREHALHALIQMRNSGRNGVEKDCEKRLRRQSELPDLKGAIGSRDQDSEQRLSPHHKSGKPNVSSQDCNVGDEMSVRVNGVRSGINSRAGSSRPRRNSGTSSSTSTNSQGGALMKGAVTGNSHAPVEPGYQTSPPNQKRVRKK